MYRTEKKNGYFKPTPRQLLTETEKTRLVGVVDRATDHLARMSRAGLTDVKVWGRDFLTLEALATAVDRMRRHRKYFDRLFAIAKGSSQPGFFYRDERRLDVAVAAAIVADHTGAQYDQVRDVIVKKLRGFVIDSQ